MNKVTISGAPLFAEVMQYLSERPSDDTKAHHLLAVMLLFFQTNTEERRYCYQDIEREWL